MQHAACAAKQSISHTQTRPRRKKKQEQGTKKQESLSLCFWVLHGSWVMGHPSFSLGRDETKWVAWVAWVAIRECDVI